MPHGSRWLVYAKQRCKGRGKIDGLNASMVDASGKGRSIKAKRHMTVIGVGREVGRAVVLHQAHLKSRRDNAHVPAAIGCVAVREKIAKGCVRQFAGSKLQPRVAPIERRT